MSLACLVYVAKLRVKSAADPLLYQHKDMNTRIYARERITGVLIIAGGYLFEIMEGDYGAVESNFDRVSSSAMMKDSEVLIFTGLKERQFEKWVMDIFEVQASGHADLSVLRVLGQQTQSDPSSTPVAAKSMFKLFCEQFANSSHSDAA